MEESLACQSSLQKAWEADLSLPKKEDTGLLPTAHLCAGSIVPRCCFQHVCGCLSLPHLSHTCMKGSSHGHGLRQPCKPLSLDLPCPFLLSETPTHCLFAMSYSFSSHRSHFPRISQVIASRVISSLLGQPSPCF